MMDDTVTTQKPYIIRAMHEWMLDYSHSPRLIVCPLIKGVALPDNLKSQEQLTLDIAPSAVENLSLGNMEISFHATFNGASFDVLLPMNCIYAITAKEREVGYVFDIDEYLPPVLDETDGLAALKTDGATAKTEAPTKTTKAPNKRPKKPSQLEKLMFWRNTAAKNAKSKTGQGGKRTKSLAKKKA